MSMMNLMMNLLSQIVIVLRKIQKSKQVSTVFLNPSPSQNIVGETLSAVCRPKVLRLSEIPAGDPWAPAPFPPESVTVPLMTSSASGIMIEKN